MLSYQFYTTLIMFTYVISTGMAEPKMTKSRVEQLGRHIKKAIRDGEIPKARQMIGQMVRDWINNTCL